MNTFNQGIKFEPVNRTPQVSFSDVVVSSEEDRDSLDEKGSFSTYKKQEHNKILNIKKRRCCGIIIITTLILLFISILAISSLNNSGNWLTAKFSVHHYHHKTIDEQCNSTEYGCCKVYELCHINKYNKLTFEDHNIWPSVQIRHNKLGTNCPRLNKIQDEYNSYYYSRELHCENSTYGCCSIDISCDAYIYLERFIDENISHTFSEGEIIRYLDLGKIDSEGSNCPSINHIIFYYNMGFKDPLMDYVYIVIALLIIACVIGCMENK
tara:strand:- start:761 stop:1561 length:801 start_codon:yes stop_codon:yes gene_type:complete